MGKIRISRSKFERVPLFAILAIGFTVSLPSAARADFFSFSVDPFTKSFDSSAINSSATVDFNAVTNQGITLADGVPLLAALQGGSLSYTPSGSGGDPAVNPFTPLRNMTFDGITQQINDPYNLNFAGGGATLVASGIGSATFNLLNGDTVSVNTDLGNNAVGVSTSSTAPFTVFATFTLIKAQGPPPPPPGVPEPSSLTTLGGLGIAGGTLVWRNKRRATVR